MRVVLYLFIWWPELPYFPPAMSMSKQQRFLPFTVLVVFYLVIFGADGEQLYSRALAKSGVGYFGATKREAACPVGDHACPADLGGGCCPHYATCALNICQAGLDSCTLSIQVVCGTNCCTAPLVCDESTLECIRDTQQHNGTLTIRYCLCLGSVTGPKSMSTALGSLIFAVALFLYRRTCWSVFV